MRGVEDLEEEKDQVEGPRGHQDVENCGFLEGLDTVGEDFETSRGLGKTEKVENAGF